MYKTCSPCKFYTFILFNKIKEIKNLAERLKPFYNPGPGNMYEQFKNIERLHQESWRVYYTKNYTNKNWRRIRTDSQTD